MIVKFDSVEEYPVYITASEKYYEGWCEMTQEELDKYHQVTQDYRDMQDLINFRIKYGKVT